MHLGTGLALATVLVAVGSLTGCGGSGQDVAKPAASASRGQSPTASSSPSPSASAAAPVLSGQELRVARRELYRQVTATFSAVPRGGGAYAARLPRTEGSWSLRPIRTASRTTIDEGNGVVTQSVIGIGRRTYVQVLGAGSPFTRACWLRTPGGTSPGALNAVVDAASDGTRSTMLLSDVLSALGYQKYVSTEGSALDDVRVTVDLRTRHHLLSGWSVAASDLDLALEGTPASDGRDLLRRFLSLVPEAAWDVAFTGIGKPVSIPEPSASSIVEPDGTNREACT